jgi:hypothetical protein
MQQLQAALDDSGTYQATKDDLTGKMNALAKQLIELDGTRVVMDRDTVDDMRALLKELFDKVPPNWSDINDRLGTALTNLSLSLDE